ncbi:nucleotidyltransferase family protein [Ferrimonas futtsuensis]|uniref:nucleotidyltransferase family protein n=1 Tax=Ferrimonas futtsuensis TaxID=364764 RepID=UPI00047F680C|nr:nucleotidyltransferase family protein [Ferrimonas futtsuensis]
MFEAAILAGGKGTRLKSVTGELPKPMVEINGIPFLYMLMKRLEEQGCSKIVLSLGYRAEYIVDRVSSDAPVRCPVEFAVEEAPLGTGGAIKMAAKHISADKFLVINGDTYLDIDYLSLFSYADNFDLTISGIHVDDVSRYGTLELDEFLNVKRLCEKGRIGSGVINSGTYVVSTKKILSFNGERFSFEQDYLEGFNGTFKAFVTNGQFIDIGIPEDYFKACKIL